MEDDETPSTAFDATGEVQDESNEGETYTGIPPEELGADVPFPVRGEPGEQGPAGSVLDDSTEHQGDTPAG